MSHPKYACGRLPPPGLWSVFPPTENDDPEKWEWKPESNYIHPSLTPLYLQVERMKSVVAELERKIEDDEAVPKE